MKLHQTQTPVHSQETQSQQRWEAYVRDEHKLSALCIAAQLWMGHCMYLMDHVSTSAYISLLMLALPFFLLYIFAHHLRRAGKEADGDLLTSLLPRRLSGLLSLLLSLSLFLDAVLLLYGAVSLTGEILPTLRRWLIAPLFAAFCAFSLAKGRPFAMVRTAGMVFFPLLLIILLSAAPSLNQGSFDHFFPLRGQGMSGIFRGAAWMCAGIAPVCLPQLLPGEPQALLRMRSMNHGRSLLLLLTGYLFACLIAALYTYLLPPYALSRPLSAGIRLLLPARISASVPGWTLFVCSQLLLCMIAYTASADRCAAVLYHAFTGKRHSPALLLFLVFCLTLPVPMLYSHTLQRWLMTVAPFRVAPYLLILLIAPLGAWCRRRKNVS